MLVFPSTMKVTTVLLCLLLITTILSTQLLAQPGKFLLCLEIWPYSVLSMLQVSVGTFCWTYTFKIGKLGKKGSMSLSVERPGLEAQASLANYSFNHDMTIERAIRRHGQQNSKMIQLWHSFTFSSHLLIKPSSYYSKGCKTTGSPLEQRMGITLIVT